jgi:calcineurin-like phosphoesterase family protein
MSKTWITSDWHLGEDRMKIMQRPFASAEEHLETIIANHNKVVSKDDRVYVNGDVIYQKADPSIYLQQIARLNGRKFLIRGNHDRPFTDEQFAPYFEWIVAEGEGMEIDVPVPDSDPIQCYITHYPTHSRADKFNLVGHIHGAWKFQLNQINVGIDVNHFYPMDMAEIPFFFTAITQFYDSDVWQAYSPVNQQYVGTRGKQSRYFNPEVK